MHYCEVKHVFLTRTKSRANSWRQEMYFVGVLCLVAVFSVILMGCFTLIIFHMLCDSKCSVALPRGATS